MTYTLELTPRLHIEYSTTEHDESFSHEFGTEEVVVPVVDDKFTVVVFLESTNSWHDITECLDEETYCLYEKLIERDFARRL